MLVGNKRRRGYGATFARATRGFIDALLDAARVGAGMQLLDLACGPGLVAGAARLRGAMPTGLDFAAAMIGLARATYPEIRFEEGDAEALPFADASFDAVVSNFGIHHVPDPVRAVSEARRILRPDGRLAFTSWSAPVENIAWKLLFPPAVVSGIPWICYGSSTPLGSSRSRHTRSIASGALQQPEI